MKVLNVDSYTTKQCCDINNISLRSNPYNKKYEIVQKEREYLDSKTEALSDLGIAMFILGLITDGANFRMREKRSATQKLGVGCIIASFIMLMAGSIWKMKLAHQYKKEGIEK